MKLSMLWDSIFPQGLYELLLLRIFYNCDYKCHVQKQMNNALRHVRP